jgi:hypothetical protein
MVFCRVSDHVSDPRCISLTRAAGSERRCGWGCTGGEASPKYRISCGRDSEVIAGHPHAPRRATPKPCSMDRVAHRSEEARHAAEPARLDAEAETVLAVRAAGQSLWGSELSPLFLQLVLEYLQWDPALCGVMRAVCSTWGSILDALLPRLDPRGSATVMKDKLGWYQSVTEVDLWRCEEEEDVSSVLAELASMPSLRSLVLPSSCAERAVDAEAVCGLTTLTTLRFEDLREEARHAHHSAAASG